MILIDNFNQVAAQIESERGISREVLVSAIEQALVSACRKKFPEETMLIGQLDVDTGNAKIFLQRTVVKKVEDENLEITLKEAKGIQSDAKLDDVIETDVTPEDFGRIAAQTAKQVIIQRIREAEKTSIYNSYIDRVDQIITGTVQRVEGRNLLINLGRAEALLTPREQIQGETFYAKDTIRVYLASIDKDAKGAHILISRGHPNFLRKLFELEIPEIPDGIIEIMSISREPGVRAKVAVKTNNAAIGAVGTCVGHMGGRIQAVIKELSNEKIDVLEWDEDPRAFISNALKPAKVSQVIITSQEERTAIVVVPLDQLSLAIGKNGVNVRLSVKLTGWKLDIISEEEYAKKADSITSKTHVSIIDKIKRDKALQDADDELEFQETEVDVEKKVSELAKELKLKTADLMEKASSFGVEIKSNRALLTPSQVKTIKENLE